MAEIVGKKMSQYTSVDTLTPEQKSAFLGSAAVTVFGTDPEDASAKANYRVPLSEITPSPAVPTKLSDLTDDITTSEYSASGTAPVDGTAVAAALGGLATVASTGNYSDLNGVPTIPTASGLAGDGLEEAGGKLKVVTKVPSPGTNEHRGHVLKVDNSDTVVWDAPASPTVTVDNATIKNGNDGLYVNSGRGLQLGSGALMCKLKENGGLEFNENDDSIQVVADTGLALTGTGGIGINFAGANNNEVLTCSKTVDGADVTYAAVWKPGIPPVGTNQHRGDVLTVDDSDQVVWDAAPGSVEISQYNGDLSAVSATNDASSGGYVFDVNLDSNTLEKRSTTGAGQISYIAVKNPVPTPAAADQGKVLSVLDAAGGIGWATPQGGSNIIVLTGTGSNQGDTVEIEDYSFDDLVNEIKGGKAFALVLNGPTPFTPYGQPETFVITEWEIQSLGAEKVLVGSMGDIKTPLGIIGLTASSVPGKISTMFQIYELTMDVSNSGPWSGQTVNLTWGIPKVINFSCYDMPNVRAYHNGQGGAYYQQIYVGQKCKWQPGSPVGYDFSEPFFFTVDLNNNGAITGGYPYEEMT